MWKDIEGYEGLYQISDSGEVRSLERVINNRLYPQRILDPCIRGGYVTVRLSKNNERRCKHVAQLVLRAFVGPPPDGGYAAVHINGNLLDNRLENLKWYCRKAYNMPENKEAKEMFYKYCYSCIRKWAAENKMFDFNLGHVDIEDAFQEAAWRVWRDINSYDDTVCSFQRFVSIRCDRAFKSLYKKEKKPTNIHYIDEYSTTWHNSATRDLNSSDMEYTRIEQINSHAAVVTYIKGSEENKIPNA